MLSTIAGCGGPSPAAAPETPPPARSESTKPAAPAPLVIKAALFPYIPDSAGDKFASLIAKLESGFEAAQPGVDLQITINGDLDPYDSSAGGTLSKLLGKGADAMQIVEVDTVLMGTLVANDWVQPSGISNPGALPAAWQAASVGGTAYGVPTYLCTNVVYSSSSAIGTAKNGTDLIGILSKIKPGVTPLVGNYKGSWTLPSTYVDAWADTNGAASATASFTIPLDPKTMGFFSSVVNGCTSSTKANPCLDGSYKQGAGAETAFASGNAGGFIGYTEQLFAIRHANPSAPLPAVISAPIGDGSNPLMFVDALVFNPGCVGACLSAAQAFATYMSSVAVRNIIAFSQDGPQGTLPRYLLQANPSFYSSSPASSDPMYKAYTTIVNRATPFPNTGFPEGRTALNDALTAALTSAPAKQAPTKSPPAKVVKSTKSAAH